MDRHLAGFAFMPVQSRKAVTSSCCAMTPALVPLKILRSSAYAETPGRSSPESWTPELGSFCSAWRRGLIAAENKCGLSGHPWNTPTRCMIGSVGPSAALPTTKVALS
ncbi:hypothetical protein PF008_g30487 [Phytophthora fragariae]|uniref:Uncharacterized protein n=1 Tax=Phytophthora fragariae TaxID=53985 RepID=A0A6G0Q628_9STRA|nr:hypothetical protein PF008_g30487 [Phytophthora fragariae]